MSNRFDADATNASAEEPRAVFSSFAVSSSPFAFPSSFFSFFPYFFSFSSFFSSSSSSLSFLSFLSLPFPSFFFVLSISTAQAANEHAD